MGFNTIELNLVIDVLAHFFLLFPSCSVERSDVSLATYLKVEYGE